MITKKLELNSNIECAVKMSRYFYSCLLTLSILAVFIVMVPTVNAEETSPAPKTATAISENTLSKNNHWIAPSEWMLYSVPIVVFLGTIIGITNVRKALPETWSLADALSEEVAIKPATKTTTTHDANGNLVTIVEDVLDKDDKPVLLPEMRASSSRVIALMGMIAIMFMYIGFGIFALYSFGAAGELSDELKGVVSYLVSGMTLFAPYAVNKFASQFEGLTGAK
ncbi:hypothetical protein [Candidatus Methylobacter oryzae]|uniref:MotA/TolQ/ExbB proton channel domain-containing protein n=1 Tax=Candidatus Methylobacter oryzae TaxID=2497749 RepID=A0ABY3CAG3_9GAMM|nr:hypothetical protein [Candidatus Methylobacter oryzae]TRW95145.1 hypothetical protein EKO24_010520 [Candidatus Methylobacter oryzae]